MILEITDYFGAPVKLQPRVELYSVRDFMGREMPGLAIVLDEVMGEPDEMEPNATLTVSFGEFIGLKNSAYIDTNNCRFAQQLLDQGIAEDTGLRKSSGFCEYPLWGFKKEFLEEIGGENYAEYSQRYDAYMKAAEEMFGGEDFDDEEPNCTEDDGMAMQ